MRGVLSRTAGPRRSRWIAWPSCGMMCLERTFKQPMEGAGHGQGAVRALRGPGRRVSRRPTPGTASRSSTATPTARPCRARAAIDFTPGELLGSVSGELGLRQFLEAAGHTLVVTSDKEGPDSVFDRELADADVVISQPFWPAYLTAERIARAPKLKLALTAGHRLGPRGPRRGHRRTASRWPRSPTPTASACPSTSS